MTIINQLLVLFAATLFVRINAQKEHEKCGINVICHIGEVFDAVSSVVSWDTVEDGIVGSFNILKDGVQCVPDMVEKLSILATRKATTKSANPQIEAFVPVLKHCVIQMQELTNVGNVFEELLPGAYEILDTCPNIATRLSALDISQDIYRLAATALFPMKDQIIFICGTGNKEEGPSFIERMINVALSIIQAETGLPVAPTPSPVADNCDDGWCSPATPIYAYDTGSYHKLVVESLRIHFPLVGAFTTSEKETTSNDVAAKFRVAIAVLDYIELIAGGVVDALGGCTDVANAIQCTAGIIAAVFIPGVSLTHRLAQFMLDSADAHDDSILETKVDALFEDRTNIIDNQFSLRDDNRNEFDKLTKFIDGGFEDIKTLINLPNIDHMPFQPKNVYKRYGYRYSCSECLRYCAKTDGFQDRGMVESNNCDDECTIWNHCGDHKCCGAGGKDWEAALCCSDGREIGDGQGLPICKKHKKYGSDSSDSSEDICPASSDSSD